MATLLRALWLALVVLHLVWFGVLTPAESLGRVGTALLVASPLLVMLIWMWRPGLRATVVGGMVLLIYFCLGVSEAWATSLVSVRALALVQIALITVYYGVLFRSWQQGRAARRQPE